MIAVFLFVTGSVFCALSIDFEMDTTKAFQYAFIILVIFTILSSITFSRLNKTDGRGYM